MEYLKKQDEFISIHPEILECYYNIEGNIIHHQTHQTGAEYISDEEADPSSDSGSTAEALEADASKLSPLIQTMRRSCMIRLLHT